MRLYILMSALFFCRGELLKNLGFYPEITLILVLNLVLLPLLLHKVCHLRSDIWSEFPSVFDGNVKVTAGERFHIALTDDARPFCASTPRAVPYAYRDKLKAELDLLQNQGIIAPTEPTEWCAPIVVNPKKNSDKMRLCVDLSHLNKYVKREHYQSVTPATPAQAVA